MEKFDLQDTIEQRLSGGNSQGITFADVFYKPSKPEGSQDKVKEIQEKFTEGELKERSKAAADLILRNDDFGYGGKQERVATIFREAANKGSEAVKQLTAAINDELAHRKSTLRIEGSYSIQERIVDVAKYSPDGEAVLIWHYMCKNAGAKFVLRNGSTGIVEDSMSVEGKQLSREYIGMTDPLTRRLSFDANPK